MWRVKTVEHMEAEFRVEGGEHWRNRVEYTFTSEMDRYCGRTDFLEEYGIDFFKHRDAIYFNAHSFSKDMLEWIFDELLCITDKLNISPDDIIIHDSMGKKIVYTLVDKYGKYFVELTNGDIISTSEILSVHKSTLKKIL